LRAEGQPAVGGFAHQLGLATALESEAPVEHVDRVVRADRNESALPSLVLVDRGVYEGHAPAGPPGLSIIRGASQENTVFSEGAIFLEQEIRPREVNIPVATAIWAWRVVHGDPGLVGSIDAVNEPRRAAHRRVEGGAVVRRTENVNPRR